MITSVSPNGWTVPGYNTITHGRQIGPSNTGPRSIPGTTYNTRQTLSTNGATVSGNIYNKGLSITGSNITVQDCIIRDDVPTDYGNILLSGSGNRVQYCEIDNTSNVYYCVDILANGTSVSPNVIHRNYIHHGGQAISAAYNWWQFTENYVTDIVAPDPSPNPPDDIWHADAVIAWGANMVVARNKMLVNLNQTGVINIGTWSGSTQHVDNVSIDSNYIAGAGYIFYIEDRSGTYDVTNMTITDNDIGDDFYATGGFYGIWYGGAPPAVDPTVTGNRLVDASAGGAFISNVTYPF